MKSFRNINWSSFDLILISKVHLITKQNYWIRATFLFLARFGFHLISYINIFLRFSSKLTNQVWCKMLLFSSCWYYQDSLLSSFSKPCIVFILLTYNDASFIDPHHHVMAIHWIWLGGPPVIPPTSGCVRQLLTFWDMFGHSSYSILKS
jgi:hypothetical protein